MQRNRTKSTLTQVIMATLLVALLVLGAFHATEAGPKKSYPALDLFTEVFAKVQNLYVKETDPKDLVYFAINGMLQSLDSHSSFMTPEMMREMRMQISGEYGGLGMQIGKAPTGPIRIEGVFEDTPADEAGLKPHDLIVKIDGESTNDMTVSDAANRMRGTPNTKVTISVVREGWVKPKDITLTRRKIKLKSVKKKEVLENAYGYIKISSFQDNTTREVEKALKKMEEGEGIKGLILDLRNNPGGPLREAINLSDLFISKGLIVSIKGRPGQRRDNREFPAKAPGTHPDYPIIVLVNAGSASASEIVAGALQDHGRAVILGTKTFGKGSVQTILEMKDGSGLRLTTALYYTPSGKSIQATGIEPDIVVENAPAGTNGQGRRIREADLPHHFENPNKNPDGEPVTVDPEDRPDEPGATGEPAAEGEDETDIQLERALELLKSWAIFKTTEERRAASVR